MAVDPHLQAAAQLISKGQINEAKQIISQVIKSDNQNADAWYLAASIMDEPDRQIQALERALAINPNHERAQHALTQLTGGRHQQVQARPPRASAAYSAEDYVDTGLVAAEHGDIPGALSAFSKAIRFDPKCVDAYVKRGQIYQSIEQYEDALADYRQVLQLDPRHPQANAIREFVENADKPDWRAYLEGTNMADQGNYSRAIDHYNEAIKLNGKVALYYVGRAKAYQERGNLNATLSDLDKAVKLNSKSPDILLARGKARALKDDYNGAINDFSQALKLDESADAYLERGKAESKKENYKAAVKDLTQAITLDPQLAEAYGYRGLARIHLKDLDGAHEDYQAAIAIEPAQMQATELLIKIEQSRRGKK